MSDINMPIWRSGQLVEPQHMQSLSYFHSQMLARHIRNTPFYWGIHKCELEVAALKRGQVVMRAIAGIFQDGSQFEWCLNDEPLCLDAVDAHKGDILFICLASTDITQTCESQTRPVRYCVISRQVADCINPEDVTTVEFAKTYLYLQWARQAPGQLALPIASLSAILSSSELSFQCYGPVLNLTRCPFCMEKIEALKGQAHNLLKAHWRVDRGFIDPVFCSALNGLWSALCAVEALAHPHEIFCMIQSSWVLLSSWCATGVLLPRRYRHSEASESLMVLLNDIAQGLSYLCSENWRAIELVRQGEQPGLIAKFKADGVVERWLVALKLPKGQALLPKVDMPVKVALMNDIDKVIKFALSGLSMVQVDAPYCIKEQGADLCYEVEICEALEGVALGMQALVILPIHVDIQCQWSLWIKPKV